MILESLFRKSDSIICNIILRCFQILSNSFSDNKPWNENYNGSSFIHRYISIGLKYLDVSGMEEDVNRCEDSIRKFFFKPTFNIYSFFSV